MLKYLVALVLIGLVSISSAQVPDSFDLTTATNPVGLTLPSGAGRYETGTYANITAVSPNPYNGYIYIFTNWDAGVTDQYVLSTTVYMDDNKTVTANYQAMEEIFTAKSQGFWKNKDGLALLTLADAVYLNTLTPWLDYFNTTDLNAFKNQVKAYFKETPRTSMQLKLGMQLLTAELNVRYGFLNSTRDVWYDADMDGVYDAGENLNIGTIMTNAAAAWSSGIDQAYYKNLLNWINNNRLLYLVY